MAFPTTLTNAVDGVTEIIAAHLNSLEAKVGIDASAVTTSLDYLLKSTSSIDPGHHHSALWASDNSPQAVGVDATGVVTLNQYTTAGFIKNSAAGALSGGNALTGEFQKARAYRSAAQTLNSSAWTLIQIDTDTFDPDNITSLGSPNYYIKPTKAGYYIVVGEACVSVPTTGLLNAMVLKNGSVEFGTIIYYNSEASTRSVGLLSQGICYLNGSSDYVQMNVWSAGAYSLDVSGGYNSNFISVVGPF